MEWSCWSSQKEKKTYGILLQLVFMVLQRRKLKEKKRKKVGEGIITVYLFQRRRRAYIIETPMSG